MRQLTLIDTLEFYDVPQIVTAVDATGTRYLCALFRHNDAHFLKKTLTIAAFRALYQYLKLLPPKNSLKIDVGGISLSGIGLT